MKKDAWVHGSIRRILLPLITFFMVATCQANELVINTQDFPPFTYMKDGEVAGPAVDIIKAVCKEMGQPCNINLMPWPRAQHEVKTGKAQALFVIGWNPERATWLEFSLPIFNTEYGIFTHVNNPLIFKEISQLKGYSVAVYGPSNTLTTLEKIKKTVPGMKIDMTPDDIAAFKKLDADRVKAVFSNKDVGIALLKQLELKNVRYAGMQSKLNYYIAFSRANSPKGTVDKFNEVYKKLYQSREIQKLLKGYGMKPAAIE